MPLMISWLRVPPASMFASTLCITMNLTLTSWVTPRVETQEVSVRFMVMHKVDANMEAGGTRSQEIIKGMGALVQESLRNGVFTTGAGLHRSARRARLGCKGGKCTEEKGPYQGKPD